jgi:DNA-binding CsgD family transcriptional regulator
MTALPQGPIPERVLQRLRPAAVPGQCWTWDGAHDDKGYAKLRNARVSRILLGLTDPRIEARHRCDNPPCVNPEHLEPGTHAQNMADMVARRRQPRGERRRNAKLTATQVHVIREDLRSARAIAEDFGVSADLIAQIKRGETWTHVPVVAPVVSLTRHRYDALSPTQLRVLQGIAAGMTNSQIAGDLGVRTGTVAKQSCRLFRKLGARDRAHAVRLCFERGVLTPDTD